jgi:hypothetical protein
MGRRKTPKPEHQGPHEQRLREVVSELVQEESQKAAYLAFAHELMAARRRSARQDSPEFRYQKPECRMGGYTPEPVKRVVMKWFRRGLSGHLMRLIGDRIRNGYGR